MKNLNKTMHRKNNAKSIMKKMPVKNVPIGDYIKHETKKSALVKFLAVSSVLAAYLVFSLIHYGRKDGLLVTAFTWSMFVLCTPIADAGFLIDFPVRMFTKMRMIYSELIVWGTAIILNIFGLVFMPSLYSKTGLLKILHIILINPFPYWIIILISAGGTFLSIYFGDELVDVAFHKERKKHHKHKNKYMMIMLAFLILLIIFFYHHLIEVIGISF